MNKFIKIFILVFLSFLMCRTTNASDYSIQVDSVRITHKAVKTGEYRKDNNSQDNYKRQPANVRESGLKDIKQIKGARPDMSKARGARPPDIQRPNGSRIPKGIGRPGGAIRPGRF
jgi:hypothetical protein